METVRLWVDMHDTRVMLPDGTPSTFWTSDKEALANTQHDKLIVATISPASNPATYEADYSGMLSPHIPEDDYKEPIKLRSTITASVMDKWIYPTSINQLMPGTDDFGYYYKRVAPFELSPLMTERLKLLQKCNLKLSFNTSIEWSKWGYFWGKFVEEESDIYDPDLIASVRPDATDKIILSKVTPPAVRRRYEIPLMAENDPAVIAEAEPYVAGFLIPYTMEELSKLPVGAQRLYRMLFKYMGDRIVPLSDDPEKDTKNLVSLAFSV